MLSVRVYLHLNFTSSNVIWILDETHSCHKIRFVTILRIFRSFSRSKPSLTIAPEFGKTIEKPSISMVDLQKNIQWWWSRDGKPLKNHQWQWCLGKKHYHPIVIKKLPSLKSTVTPCNTIMSISVLYIRCTEIKWTIFICHSFFTSL